MTQEISKGTPVDRLNYSGNLEPVVKRLGVAYKIGKIQDFSVITTGYEDCNIVVTTEKGKYIAKIFSKTRTPEDVIRYSNIMEQVVNVGVNHPPLLRDRNGNIVYKDIQVNDLNLVLMKFIEGKTFFEINRPPNKEERQAVVEQAAKINNIDYRPTYIFDLWAIPNIKIMFKKTKQFIKSEDISLIEQVITRYDTVPVNSLPHCFVHGDFTKANVLKSNNERIYILDFSVANWYPRIQELAVIAANLMHDDKNIASLKDRTEIIKSEYNQFNKLTPEESKWIYDYALAGVAMEFIGSHQEKYINGNDTIETEYWMNLGREGLKRELR